MSTGAGADGETPRAGVGGKSRPSGTLLLVLIVSLLAYAVWSLVAPQVTVEPRIPYSAAMELVEAGAVERVTLRGEDVSGVLRAARALRTTAGDTVHAARFRTTRPPVEDPSFLELLRTSDVQIEAVPGAQSSWWRTLVLGLLPLLALVVLWMFLLGRLRGPGEGALAFGRSGARVYDRSTEKTTFDDVAGARGAKQELAEIVEFLRRPERFRRLGAEIPKGVLLMGPPGTGKTLLARAVAGEAGVSFFSITGSDFMEMFVGIGPKRVRDLFQAAKSAAPSIIFIDELDAIGGRRGAGVWVGGADERERTLNQLLSEMSGFEPNESVIVLAATNRPDVLDAALLRPGRFDRRITVELPTQMDRHQILRLHARFLTLAPDVDLEAVARGTPGFSGADLKNLLNEAALHAARRDAEHITGPDLDEARDKVLMGLEREGLAPTDREIRLLSFHEAGHAVLAAVLPHTDPLHKVTIVPRGRAMGITQQLPESERYIYEREYMLDRITVMLGGRAAEQLMCDTATTGAEDDLHQAVALARRMVLDWGMSDTLGLMVSERPRETAYLGPMPPQAREVSEETARRADAAVESILHECHARARETLRAHRVALARLAERLREVEELTGEEVVTLIRAAEREAPAAAETPPTPGTGHTSEDPEMNEMERRPAGPRGRPGHAWVGTVVALLGSATVVAGCAGTSQNVVLEPAVQPGDATIDVESGTVRLERDGIFVSAQGAMLPAPRRDGIHPTFWVTVENTRDEPVSVRPAGARLVDTFGNQLAPLPMSVDRASRDVRYALVDPEIHTYVSLRFGWPYYPLYPYRGWFAYPRSGRYRPWRYDPFWTMGIGPVWIVDIRPRPAPTPAPAIDPEREETVYHDAKITYVVVFPELDRMARDVRLVVPGVLVKSTEAWGPELDFELVFRQIVEVGRW